MDTLKLFDSERTRLRDEVASLIPKSLWDVYFDRTLTGIDRALLTATPDQIFTLLSQPEIQTLSTKRKRCCWIAIYCQHTELDSNLLIQIAIALQINLIEFIQEKDYQFFILTALNLRIDLLISEAISPIRTIFSILLFFSCGTIYFPFLVSV